MNTEGIISDKKPYTGNSSNAPAGDIFMERTKFACWDKPTFDKVVIGEKVTIEYSEKVNEFNGKQYVNKSIVSIGRDSTDTPKVDETDIRFSEEEKAELEKVDMSTDVKSPEDIPFQSEPFKVSGFTYKIVGTLKLV